MVLLVAATHCYILQQLQVSTLFIIPTTIPICNSFIHYTYPYYNLAFRFTSPDHTYPIHSIHWLCVMEEQCDLGKLTMCSEMLCCFWFWDLNVKQFLLECNACMLAATLIIELMYFEFNANA